jgi:SRSO17 transposase
MLNISQVLKYPLLNLLSIGKKSFENLAGTIHKSGKAVSRWLQPSTFSLGYAQHLCQSMFRGEKKLLCIIDDTLIKKIYSEEMQGAGMFYDSKVGKQIMAYKLIICLISDGKFAIPIECAYLFSKELLDLIPEKFQSKEDIAKTFIQVAIKLFSKAKIIVVADGLYATVSLLKWCYDNGIAAEMRMHSNRVITFKEEKVSLRKLATRKGIRPKGRKMARTVSALWHDMELEFSIVRRIDKKGIESIVFQVATYKAIPHEHVANYKKRWAIEKMIRTSKQHLGLQDCYSKSLQTQHNHVASVLVSYALVQLDMKRYRLKTPEQAIRRFKKKNANILFKRLERLNQSYECGYA